MVQLMRIGVQTLKLVAMTVAFPAEEEVIAILAHPTMFQYLFLAAETLIFFVLLDL